MASHAVVSLPALDLRPRADHAAELASQLLMGEVVRLLGPSRDGWRRVRNLADGYEGWVREWGLVPASARRAARWRALALGTVAAPFATLTVGQDGAVCVSPLFLGGRVIPGRRSGAWRRAELPDGRRGWLPIGALRLNGEAAPLLLDRVRSLFGTPYLWGGRTPAGYDCSAFVQQTLLEQGLPMPRDAHEQYRASRSLGPAELPAEGDLAFFRAPGERVGHVGLALGEGYFAHSRGALGVSSVDPDNPLCDKALLPQFLGWFRPRGKGRCAPARA